MAEQAKEPSLKEAVNHNQQLAATLSAKSDSKVPSVVLQKPTTEHWKNYKLVKHLPERFNWRGVSYITKDLTTIQLEALSNDKAFRAIVKE